MPQRKQQPDLFLSLFLSRAVHLAGIRGFWPKKKKKWIPPSRDSFIVDYLWKLIDIVAWSVFFFFFWAHWVTSSRHGPLFKQQCYSPTRCYGKFGSHNGRDSSGESLLSPLLLSHVWPRRMMLLFQVKVDAAKSSFLLIRFFRKKRQRKICVFVFPSKLKKKMYQEKDKITKCVTWVTQINVVLAL